VGIDKRLEVVKENVVKLKVEGLTIYKNDALRAVEVLERKGEQFNIIFFDPPYAYDEIKEVVGKVSRSNILLPGGIFAVEHDNKTVLPETLGPLTFYRRYDYGQSQITVYHTT
jgi:16S rRNA G966 N2-methylase RsmD